MAQYQDGDRRFGMVRRNGVWVSDQQDSGAQQDESPSVRIGSPSPLMPLKLRQEQGQADAAPFAAPKAAADLVRTQQQNQSQPLQNDATRQGIISSQQQRALAQQQAEQQFGQQFLSQPEVKQFQVIANQYGSALKAVRGGTKSSDYDLINAYAKLLDPGSVVREGEVKLSGEAGAASDKIYAWVNSIKGQGLLDDEQRKQIMLQVRNRAGSAADQYRLSREYWGGVAQKYGYDQSRVLGPNFAQPFQQLEADYFGHPIKNGNAMVMPHSHQQPGGEIEFGADAPPPGFTPEQTRAYDAFMSGNPNATPDQLRSFGKGMGWDIGNAEAVLEARKKGKGFVSGANANVKPYIDDKRGSPQADENLRKGYGAAAPLPLGGVLNGAAAMFGPQKTDAFVRGVNDTSTLGFADELGAAGQTLFRGGTMDQNLANQRGVDAYDKQNNFGARLGGQLAGGLLLPTSVEGVGFNAGRSALRSGLDMAAARTAAGRATALRMGQEGAALGGAYGAGSTDGGPGDRILGGLAGAAISGPISYGLGRATTALAARQRGAPPQPGIQDSADRLGIRPTPSTVGGYTSGFLQHTLSNLPGTAEAVQRGATNEINDLSAAAGRVANQLGPISSREQAGNTLTRGAQAFDRATSRQGTALYNRRDQLMGGTDARVPMGGTYQAIRNFAQQYPTSPVLQDIRVHPVVRQVEGSTENGALSLGEATDMLSHVRGALRNAQARNTTTNAEERQIGILENAIEGDVLNRARQIDQALGRSGPNSAEAAQGRADAYWRQKKLVTNGAMRTALRSGRDDMTTSGSAVYNQLANDMGAQGGNFRRLTRTWQNLPQNSRRTFAATAFDNLGRATPGQNNAEGDAWSFQTFLTNWNKLEPRSRAVVFGGHGADREIQDIATYASRLRDTDRGRNFSNTARNMLMGSYLSIVGGALFHGNLEAAGGMAAAIPAAHAGASLFMATPVMRQWTRQTLRAMNAGSEGGLRAQTNRLRTIAARQPSLAPEIMGLHQRITQAVNDNLPRAGQAAASPDGRPDDTDQDPYRRYP